MASSVVQALVNALVATGVQLACVLGPAAACAVVLHQLQRMLSATLVGTFGWRSMLLTGWLGVPVHELSHVAACVVFAHEIEEVKLFAPDPETGTLGLVRHHAPAGNPWAAVGRFFIGVAPLIGGALALLLAARLLLPEAGLVGGGPLDGPRDAFAHVGATAAAIMDPALVGQPRAWLFFYVVVCIGAHLAPSGADLASALRGALALVASVFVVNLVASAFGGITPEQVRWAAGLTTPVVALLVIAAALCAAVLAAALLLAAVVERARGGRGHLRRFVVTHWARLALGGVTAATFAVAADL